jgi:hypothetical protein
VHPEASQAKNLDAFASAPRENLDQGIAEVATLRSNEFSALGESPNQQMSVNYVTRTAALDRLGSSFESLKIALPVLVCGMFAADECPNVE